MPEILMHGKFRLVYRLEIGYVLGSDQMEVIHRPDPRSPEIKPELSAVEDQLRQVLREIGEVKDEGREELSGD